MATTAVGNPYVESSDLVANYPGVSETLAERLDVVGVNPFADAAARTTAIPSPVEGQMSSLSDTDSVERYDGSAWKPVGGKILQVLSTTKVDPFTTTSTSYVDLTGMSVAITPSATGSKILVTYKLSTNTRGSGAIALIQLVRDSTPIGGGTATGSRPSAMSSMYVPTSDPTVDLCGNYLDSPATTSATTYKLQGRIHVNTLAINTSASDADTAVQGRTSSTITVMEVSA